MNADHLHAARQGGVFDTIAAISTGRQLAAIGIVRISGPQALAVLDRVFTPLSGAPMSARPDRKLHYVGRAFENFQHGGYRKLLCGSAGERVKGTFLPLACGK